MKKRVALAPNQSKLSRRRRLISDIWYDTARGAQEALVSLGQFPAALDVPAAGYFSAIPTLARARQKSPRRFLLYSISVRRARWTLAICYVLLAQSLCFD